MFCTSVKAWGAPGSADVAGFFRSAADANLVAFQSLVITPAAAATKVSVVSAESSFATANTDYALVRIGNQVVASLPSYFGTGASADYAELAGSMALYERTAELMATYSSLGTVDPKTLALTGIANEGAIDSAISLAGLQLKSNIGWLRSKGVNPTTAAADNEIAGIDQNGEVSDRFSALGDYWDGYLNSRVLAYLGGFANP
jgi:hypothetical protein